MFCFKNILFNASPSWNQDNNCSRIKRNYFCRLSVPIERFHSSGQQPRKFYWTKRKCLDKKRVQLPQEGLTNMAPVSFFWNTNMAGVTPYDNSLLWCETAPGIVSTAIRCLQHKKTLRILQGLSTSWEEIVLLICLISPWDINEPSWARKGNNYSRLQDDTPSPL